MDLPEKMKPDAVAAAKINREHGGVSPPNQTGSRVIPYRIGDLCLLQLPV